MKDLVSDNPLMLAQKRYRDKFNDIYPTEMTQFMSEEEVIADIDKCIKSNKKKEVNIKDVLY